MCVFHVARYSGNLGDFASNKVGEVNVDINDVPSTLFGHQSIFGRSVVVSITLPITIIINP